jgi:hypothetical protein
MGATPENLKSAIFGFLKENPEEAAGMTVNELYEAIRKTYPCGLPEFAGTILLMQLKGEIQGRDAQGILAFALPQQ